MKSINFNIVRYDADEGKVFDWKDPRFETDSNNIRVRQHLYAKTLFIGSSDNIDNYVEVNLPKEE